MPGSTPALPVARCQDCGLVVYPETAASCPRCTAAPLTVSTADGDGVIWSVTVQRFPPKSPPYQAPAGGFVPFAVAYVETAEGFRVEAIVAADDPGGLRIGQPVSFTGVVDDVPRYRPHGELLTTAVDPA